MSCFVSPDYLEQGNNERAWIEPLRSQPEGNQPAAIASSRAEMARGEAAKGKGFLNSGGEL